MLLVFALAGVRRGDPRAACWRWWSLILLGGVRRSPGIGLLVASRAKTMETVSGLMNLVMLPMWVLSGIFFSSERFPDAVQPFIQALPLTALIDALRAVMLEGASLASQWPEVAILAAWGLVSFVLALRLFRWSQRAPAVAHSGDVTKPAVQRSRPRSRPQ